MQGRHIFLAESKGISSTHGKVSSSLDLKIFAPLAERDERVSVGSPIYPPAPTLASFSRSARLDKVRFFGEERRRSFTASASRIGGAEKSYHHRVSVSVPVLSVAMNVVAPRVSTACKRRMIAFDAAMVRTPRASVTVTMAGNPSGSRQREGNPPPRNEHGRLPRRYTHQKNSERDGNDDDRDSFSQPF